MVDIVSKATRSRMMSGIRGKHTKPELLVRKFFHRCGLRYLLHDPRLPGKPDLVLPRFRVVVNVHGCFWHQHRGCRFAYMPASNRSFWRDKLQGNVLRDRRIDRQLRRMGWRVFTLWECEVEDARRLTRIVNAIRGSA